MIRPRLARLVSVLVVINVVVAGAAVLFVSDASPSRPAATGELALDLPSRHAAGDPMAVGIEGIATGVESVDVTVSTAAGTVRRSVVVPSTATRQDTLLISIAGEALVAAGPTVVWVLAGGDSVAATVEIEAGPAVDPLTPLAGPKSIVTDGLDRAMIVALPADVHGNAVPDRDDVSFRTVRPEGAVEEPATIVTGLVTWTRLTAGVRAGRSVISATLGAAGGPAAEVDEVADRPVRFALSWTDARGTPLVADGRRLHRLATDRIVDRNGNVVPDGTAVTLRAVEPTGVRQATASTIDGRAEFHIEAPDRPGRVTASAAVAGVSSEELVLDFVPAPVDVPVRIAASDGGAILEIGPIVSTIGGWVPDGTEVGFAPRGAGEPTVAVVLDGRATLRLDQLRPEGTLSVLGVDVEVAR